MAVAMREVGFEADGAPDPAKTATLNRLRQAIADVQAAPRRYLVTLSTGLSELDALGLFRLGRGVELCGEEASGRASVAGRLVAGACREKRLSAWVDGPRELYPPALVDLGVELSRLLVVRPKAPKQLVWSAVQLLRSGAFTCVVLDVTHTGVKLPMLEAKKLVEAARTGGSLLVLLTSQGASAQGLVRLELSTAQPEPASARPELVERRLALAATTAHPAPVEGGHQPTCMVPLRTTKGGQYVAPAPREAWSEVLGGAGEVDPPFTLTGSIETPTPFSPSGVEGRRVQEFRSVPVRSSTPLGLTGSGFALLADRVSGVEGCRIRAQTSESGSRQGSTSLTLNGGAAGSQTSTAMSPAELRDPSASFRALAPGDSTAQGPSEAEVAAWSARRTQAPPSPSLESAHAEAGPAELSSAPEPTRVEVPEPVTCFSVAHGTAAPPVRLVRARVVPRNAQRRAAHLRERGLEPAPVAQEPSMQRQRTSLERNGYGMRHSRPGRDSAMTIPVGAPAPEAQPDRSARAESRAPQEHAPPMPRTPTTRTADAPVLLKLRRFG